MKNPKLSTSFSLALLCAAMVLLELASHSTTGVQARYLPTRADETDVEVLKSLIRNLMMESQNDLFARNLDRMEGRQRNGHAPADRQCNFAQQTPLQLQKRARELPLPDSGAGDSSVRVPVN